MSFKPEKQALNVAMVAGEASGDLLAGLMLDGMSARWPELHSAGIGGPHMQRRGFDAWWPSEKLAVRGYVEVLRHYRGLVAIRNQLGQRLLQRRPDVFVGVDAPDFNLELEARLKAAGVPVVHFVCPSIWAWRASRVEKIRRSVNHVLCIFPFEPELLAQHGIAATYVGHPLANVIPMAPDRDAARRSLGLTGHEQVVALMPGSRSSEIEHLAERFLQAAGLLLKHRPNLKFILPAVPNQLDALKSLVQRAGLAGKIEVLQGQSHLALAACDVVLVASGTATLEAALFKRPMVIAYHMNWLSWQIMRRQKLQPWVGLPNILLQEFCVPELLQDQATPEALASGVLQWLDAPAKVHALQDQFVTLHERLQRDTSRLAADAIQEVLAR